MNSGLLKMRIGVFLMRRTFHLSRKLNNTENSCITFPELRAEIRTCGELYEKWRKEKRFRKIPSGSLYFNLSYIDTSVLHNGDNPAGDVSIPKPVALVLHGSPGSYRDFNLLTSHLHENGVGVIIPNLPDFTEYKPGIFRHSTEERVQLIKDFLKEINVPKIDTLICHSGSTYPGLKLCVENEYPTIRSLVLLNYGVFQIMRAIKPYWVSWLAVHLSDFSLGLKLLQFFGTYLFKATNVAVRVDDMLGPLLSATVIYNADLPQGKENMKALAAQNLPILLAFSENDKLMDKHLSYDVAYLLGVNDEDMFLYDENGRLSHTGVEKQFVKVMAFEKGSHFVFKKYPDIVNEAISSFMLKVLRNDR